MMNWETDILKVVCLQKMVCIEVELCGKGVEDFLIVTYRKQGKWLHEKAEETIFIEAQEKLFMVPVTK